MKTSQQNLKKLFLMSIVAIMIISMMAHQNPPSASAYPLAQIQYFDTIPPSTVANLSASTGATPGEVRLSWTAPGDDATTGASNKYTVRYFSQPITADNWAAAADVTGEPIPPHPAGSVEEMVVIGMPPGHYYFAIRSQDEAANLSEVSNSPQVSVLGENAVYLPMAVKAGPPTVIPETTEILPSSTTQYLASVSGDGSIFTFTQSTPALEEIQPGDVMVSAATGSAPYGFLRKVESVTSAGSQVVITTAPATLEDAVQSGAGQISQTLSANQIQSSIQIQGLSQIADLKNLSQFYLELRDVVLYDADGDGNTKFDQIVANGSILFQPSFDLYMEYRDGELKRYSYTASENKTVKLDISSGVDVTSLELEKEVAHYTFHPILFMIGWLPVEIVPELSIYVGVDGSVHVGVSAGVEHQTTLITRSYHENGEFHTSGEHSDEFHFTPPHLTVGLDFKGYAGAELSLLLYGVAGPYANLDAYLSLNANPAETPWWKLYAGIELSAGAEVEVMGKTLYDFHAPVFLGYRVLLASAQTNTPPDMPYQPSPADDALVQNLETNLNWSFGDQESDLLTFDVYFEQGDDTPDVVVADNIVESTFDPGSLSPDSLYYWRVVAQDEYGATTAGPVWSFQTAAGGTCPIELTVETPQRIGYEVTVDGSVSSGCSTITRLNWDWGDGLTEDQWFPAEHTYPVPGNYTVTVTAYNDLGDTKAVTTTVTIELEPGEMVLIPAGWFQMGCHPDHNGGFGCQSWELPLHDVYLDAYSIDKYEVTNARYAQCVAAGSCSPPNYDGSWSRVPYYSDPTYANYPVIEVTWDQADAYCTWAGKRLPTEAEWEKAARGTTVIAYPWGDQAPDCSRANYLYDEVSYISCVGDTSQVGSRPMGASPYGVMDMAGNVSEWVYDWYGSYPSFPVYNPTGPASGIQRTIRGGSFAHLSDVIRVAFRVNDAGYAGFLGFRCADSEP